MKTLVIYNDMESISYSILEGDFSRFHNVCINGVHGTGYEDDFVKFFFDEEGRYNFPMSNDISLIENKEWDKVVLATFLL